MRAQADPQGGFWDHEIENQKLEILLEAQEGSRAGARAYGQAHRKLKKELDGLETGVRYRIGRFVVTPQAIAGGGFDIPEWESQSYRVKALD